ncbi:MAG: phosphotransferase [Anaerolineae bacterium]|nr:phosphotransferase [Anaerolineae bacterium]
MLKLRYLFDNTDLAEMLLKNWEYDASSLDMFQYYRISANAIYPFRKHEEVCLLRFCPTSEKQKENIIAELDFIGYLRGRHYQALEPVPSKTGEELIEQATPWGAYYASVFKRVSGRQIGESTFDNDIVFAFGASLGHLHSLSSEYINPKTKRWAHTDVLTWIEDTLRTVSAEELAFSELNLLRDYFSTLPKNHTNYGLVHYDFELDNVFYDPETKSCSVIDFDDAMYHWYIMDIDQALNSLETEVDWTEGEFQIKKTTFLEGYRSHFDIDDDLLVTLPTFRRFANLYGYARIARSIQEKWKNEPEWLVELRTVLQNALRDRAMFFGKPIGV